MNGRTFFSRYFAYIRRIVRPISSEDRVSGHAGDSVDAPLQAVEDGRDQLAGGSTAVEYSNANPPSMSRAACASRLTWHHAECAFLPWSGGQEARVRSRCEAAR